MSNYPTRYMKREGDSFEIRIQTDCGLSYYVFVISNLNFVLIFNDQFSVQCSLSYLKQSQFKVSKYKNASSKDNSFTIQEIDKNTSSLLVD